MKHTIKYKLSGHYFSIDLEIFVIDETEVTLHENKTLTKYFLYDGFMREYLTILGQKS